jgi:hypothetical protein
MVSFFGTTPEVAPVDGPVAPVKINSLAASMGT